jgi:hypothetical protein
MPSPEQWKLCRAIAIAKKELEGCTVGKTDDEYAPSKRLRLQLDKVHRLLAQMEKVSDALMHHVMEVELSEKKLRAEARGDHWE